MKIIVTGGAGFIGSAVARHIINDTSDHVLVLDSLTYAGNLESLAPIADSDRYAFELVDICERPALDRVFAAFKPDAVMHLAAESHVDRSIDGPAAFIETNIVGTYTLLEAARHYWQTLDETKNRRSASTIFRPMKSTATCTALTICSQKRLPTHQAARTPPPRPPAIIWCAPGCVPTVCRLSSPTARTTTALTTSRRS